jgi:hypothetical protein
MLMNILQQRGLSTMLIKINSKPVEVIEESTEEKSFDSVYLCVSTIGYLMIFYIMDLCSSTFLGIHCFPWITWIGKIISWWGGLF